mgnify:FL=1
MLSALLPSIIVLALPLTPNLTIQAHRLGEGVSAPYEGALIRPRDWILLRSHVAADSGPRAVEACARSCENQIELILENSARVETDQALLIRALEHKLQLERQLHKKAKSRTKKAMWVAIISGSVAAGVSVALFAR